MSSAPEELCETPSPQRKPAISMLKNREHEREPALALQEVSALPQGIARWAGFALLAVVFLLQFAGFCFLAFHRLIDSDEGFYLYISKLVATQGTILYKDVFYQQMPVLPYLYGAWMKTFGFSWEAGRSFSAFLAAIVGTLLFWHVRNMRRQTLLAVGCTLLYAMNLSVLLFFLTTKTYVLSTALLFGSLLAGTHNQGRWSGWLDGMCGFLLALSVETRLFFAAAVPVFAVWFWVKHARTGRKPFWLFLTGFLLGLIPSVIFMGIAHRQFIYDNVLYHSMRDPAGLVGDFRQKLTVAKKLLFGAGLLHFTQFLFLFLNIPLVFIFWRKLGATTKLAAGMSVILGVASFLPTPTFGQYFCVLTPFLALCLAETFESATSGLSSFLSPKMFSAGFVIFSLVYSAVAVPRIGSLFLREEGVPGIGPATKSVDWKFSTVKEMANLIELHTDKDTPVVTSWPGYLLTIDRSAYPKMENQISVDTAWKISPEEANEYRMLREEDLRRAIADPKSKIVVAGNCSHGRRMLYREAARENNYRLVSKVGSSEIYAR